MEIKICSKRISRLKKKKGAKQREAHSYWAWVRNCILAANRFFLKKMKEKLF